MYLQAAFDPNNAASAAVVGIQPEIGAEFSGLCGNCNQVSDDLKLADGTDVSSSDEP